MTPGKFIMTGIVCLTVFTLLSCNGARRSAATARKETNDELNTNRALPPVYIYKTKMDYFDKVPIILTQDKLDVTAYPDRNDINRSGQFMYPTRLSGGYLLDNRGINENAAFLTLSYEQYYQMKTTPTKDELRNMILDNDPFSELYRCGSISDFKDLINELNVLIDAGDFGRFVKLK